MEEQMEKFKSGDKVLVEGQVRIVLDYYDDTCGWGCCEGYELEGEPGRVYWPSDLKEIENESCN